MAKTQVLKKEDLKKGRRVQKTVHFDPEVWELLEKHMNQSRVNNVSIAVNDAVLYSLSPQHRSDRDGGMEKLYHQLSFSLAEHRKKTARDMAFLQEMMFQYIQTYFAHTHMIPDSERGAADAQANARLDTFMEQLVAKLTQKKPEGEKSI